LKGIKETKAKFFRSTNGCPNRNSLPIRVRIMMILKSNPIK
jgi:hypothetical protein